MILFAPERFPRAPRLALRLALLAALALGLLGQTRLYYDYAWQLMSVRDHARHDTTSPFVMRSAEHTDLSRDRTEWTIGYPLAYNAVGATLAAAGMPPDFTHRTIATSAVLLGIVGLHFVLARCTQLSPLGRALALLVISLSFNGVGMLSFMLPEVFLFATVPWQMWCLWQVMADETPVQRRILLGLLLGGVTGIAYTFRYVAALHSLPLLACAALWLAWRRPALWWLAGLATAGAALLPVAAMSAGNYLHTGAINSTSSAMPWGVQAHWPHLLHWLLVLAGPLQALGGSAITFDRAAAWLGAHWRGHADFEALKLCSLWLSVGPGILAAGLLLRFAPRDRLLFTGLAGTAGTALGLLWLYTHSGLPQPDCRYSVAPALLLWPCLAGAVGAALRQSRAWRFVTGLVLLPLAPTLMYAMRAHQLALDPVLHGRRGQIIADGRVDPAALRAAVAAHLPPDSGETIWMCFQPGVLYVLDGRHAFEAYTGQPENYRSSRPVTLVVLRDRPPGMHTSTYELNYHSLDILGREPDFIHGDYDVFVRRIGPGNAAMPASP